MNVTRKTASVRDMDRDTAVKWMYFFVRLAGITSGGHLDFVKKFKSMGHILVKTPEESDYLLLFCPIVSRVGADISEALAAAPGGRPIILVVMYHTFSVDLVVPDIRRQVDKQIVPLAVSCLYHEGRFLKCDQNDIAWFEVQRFFGVGPSQIPKWRRCINWLYNNRKVVLAVSIFFVVAAAGVRSVMSPSSDL